MNRIKLKRNKRHSERISEFVMDLRNVWNSILIKSESFRFRHRFYFNQALHLETLFSHCSEQRTDNTLLAIELIVTIHSAQVLCCLHFLQIFRFLFCVVYFIYCVLYFKPLYLCNSGFRSLIHNQIMFNLGDFILFLFSFFFLVFPFRVLFFFILIALIPK